MMKFEKAVRKKWYMKPVMVFKGMRFIVGKLIVCDGKTFTFQAQNQEVISGIKPWQIFSA